MKQQVLFCRGDTGFHPCVFGHQVLVSAIIDCSFSHRFYHTLQIATEVVGLDRAAGGIFAAFVWRRPLSLDTPCVVVFQSIHSSRSVLESLTIAAYLARNVPLMCRGFLVFPFCFVPFRSFFCDGTTVLPHRRHAQLRGAHDWLVTRLI